jgi:hypothetical protein
MNVDTWNKSKAKVLFDCFMEIEKKSYPEYLHDRVDERTKRVEALIVAHGANHVTINNYTNMMQFSSSITIDTFSSGRWMDGNITIDIGSEPHELSAIRTRSEFKVGTPTIEINERFNFETMEWELIIPAPICYEDEGEDDNE